MRDQVLAGKVGNRSGIGKGRSSNVAQKPLRRDRSSAETLATRLRILLGYVPIALKLGLLVAVGVLVFLGYRAAASASFFQLRNIETRGTARASVEAVQAAVRSEVSKTGVWRANLPTISLRLEHLPWVRTAIISRVLPDGIRVRISEREPRAVVHNSAGRFVWVDDDAVLLAEMLPADQMPPFFLRGWNDEESPAAHAENRERVRKFLELQRLRKALNTLDKLRETPRGPFISYLDLNQGKRVIVGMVSGSHAVSDETEASNDAASDTASRTTARENGSPQSERKPKTASARDKKVRDSQAHSQVKADPKRR